MSGVGCDHDHRDASPTLGRAQRDEDLETAHHWHQQVEHNGVWWAGLDEFQGLAAIRNEANVVAGPSQKPVEGLPNACVVINNENCASAGDRLWRRHILN